MMELSIQFLINTLLSILGGLIWFIINNFKSKIIKIDKEIDIIKKDSQKEFQTIKENYHKKDDIQNIIERFEIKLNSDRELLEQRIESVNANLTATINMKFESLEKINAILSKK